MSCWKKTIGDSSAKASAAASKTVVSALAVILSSLSEFSISACGLLSPPARGRRGCATTALKTASPPSSNR